MSIVDKIIKLVTNAIKMDLKITMLNKELEELAYEIKNINDRLIRVETYLEISQKTKQLEYVK